MSRSFAAHLRRRHHFGVVDCRCHYVRLYNVWLSEIAKTSDAQSCEYRTGNTNE
jgi:hypothetical protein